MHKKSGLDLAVLKVCKKNNNNHDLVPLGQIDPTFEEKKNK